MNRLFFLLLATSCAAPPPAGNLGTYTTAKQIAVEFWKSSDVGIANRLFDALLSEAQRSEAIAVAYPADRQGPQVLLSEVEWSESGGGTVSFTAEFIDGTSAERRIVGRRTGVCTEARLGECARQILKSAESAFSRP